MKKRSKKSPLSSFLAKRFRGQTSSGARIFPSRAPLFSKRVKKAKLFGIAVRLEREADENVLLDTNVAVAPHLEAATQAAHVETATEISPNLSIVPAPEKIEHAVEVIAAQTERVTPVQEIRSPFAGHLSTEELIRPDDTLRQAIEAFLLDLRSPHTRRAYAKDLKRFVKFLLVRRVDRGPEKIDRSLLVGYKESLLGEGLEHTTIDRHLASLRSFFGWLQSEGLIEKNPGEAVRFLNPRKESTTVGFSDEEVKKLLQQPNLHTRIGSQHYAILMILFYCGLRRSEICDLKVSSLFVERNIPVLRLRGKGNKERIVPLVPAAHKALKHYYRISGRGPGRAPADSPMFVGFRRRLPLGQVAGPGDLRPLDPSAIFYIVRKYAKLAGIQSKVSPHSCRATAISNARDHQVPDRAIQEFAGWASPDMITRYDKRKSAIEKSAAHAIQYGETDRLNDWETIRDSFSKAPQPPEGTPDPTAEQ